MHKYIALTACLLALPLLMAGDTFTQPLAKSAQERYEAQMKRAQEAYDKAVEKARKAYLIQLERALPVATRAGDLDEAKAIQATIEQLKAGEKVEKEDEQPQRRGQVNPIGTSWEVDRPGNIWQIRDRGLIIAGDGGRGEWYLIGDSTAVAKWKNLYTIEFSPDGKTAKAYSQVGTFNMRRVK